MKTPAQTPDELVAVAKRLAERVAELEEKLEQREAELLATDLARIEAIDALELDPYARIRAHLAPLLELVEAKP